MYKDVVFALPDTAPGLSIQHGDDAGKSNRPLVTPASLFHVSSTLHHTEPVDLTGMRAVLSRDAALAKAVQLERPAKRQTTASAVQSSQHATNSDVKPLESSVVDASPTPSSFDARAAHAKLQATSKHSFARCRSCLPAHVHERYVDAVRAYLFHGVYPASAADLEEGASLTEFTSVCDLVQREQRMYRKKLHDMVVACEACQADSSTRIERIDTQQQQQVVSSGGEVSHMCTNANALIAGAEDLAAALNTARVRAFGGLNFDRVEQFLRASPQHPPSTMYERAPFDSRVLQLLRDRGRFIRGPASIEPHGRTFFNDKARNVWSPVDTEALADLLPRAAAPSASQLFVPSRPLDSALVQQLDFRASEAAVAGQWWDYANAVAAGADIVLSKSALITLATAHFNNAQTAFCLPVRCAASGGAVLIGSPLRAKLMPRKTVMTTAIKRLSAHRSSGLWTATAAAGGTSFTHTNAKVTADCTLQSISTTEEAPLPPALKVRCSLNIHGRSSDGRMLLTMTKLEYSSCKGYNFVLDDARYSYRLEDFSRRELAAAWIALQLQPQAVLHIHRICPYTQALLAVEQHDLMSITALVQRVDANGGELSAMWTTVAALLTFVRQSVLKARAGTPESTPTDFLLHRSLSGNTVQLIPADDVARSPSGAAAINYRCSPVSIAYAKQEYLPQAVWLRPRRFPLTFPTEEDQVPATQDRDTDTADDIYLDKSATVEWSRSGALGLLSARVVLPRQKRDRDEDDQHQPSS